MASFFDQVWGQFLLHLRLHLAWAPMQTDKRPLLNFNSDVAPTQESKWLNAVASLFALEFPVLAPSACAAMLLSTIPSQLNIPQIPSNWGSITLIGSGDLGKWKRGNFPKLARMFDHFCAQHGFGFHVRSTFLAMQHSAVQCNIDLSGIPLAFLPLLYQVRIYIKYKIVLSCPHT